METERIIRKRRCENHIGRKRRINPFIIYLITSPSGKCYVGQTMRGINKRWKQHCSSGRCVLLARAIKKYGSENFNITYLEKTHNKEKANNLERFYINELNTVMPKGYNMSPGGGGGIPGIKLNENTKLLMAQKRIEFYKDENNRIAQSIKKLKFYQSKEGKELRKKKSEHPIMSKEKWEEVKIKFKETRSTKEYRENKSIEQKKIWANPLLIEKHSKIIKEANFKRLLIEIKELRENMSKYTEDNINLCKRYKNEYSATS